MYDPTVTAAQVAKEIAATAHHDDPAQRFKGIYRSRVEVDGFIAHMKGLYDPESGEMARRLTEEERAWVVNERKLCTFDALYWYDRYAKIVNDENVLMRFKPNIGQRMVLDVWAELERNHFAIMMIQLKARQLGVTTLTEMEVARRIMFFPDITAVVASCDDDKSALMARKMERCVEEQPWWLVPDVTQHKVGKLIQFDNKSFVSVESGNQMSGIAMGNTPQVAHISELSDFFDAGTLVDQGLLHAVHPHTQTFLVLESTAKGFDNWWHDKWQSTIKNYARGMSRLCPIFLPWFVGTDIYPTDTWLRMHPIPEGWEPSEKVEKHAEKAATYVRTDPRLHKVYGDDWTMPREQQWFYEVSYQEAVEEDRLNKFLSEMPSDPQEAFQSTNIAAVELENWLPHHDRAMAREPVAIYGIAGDPIEIPTRHQPSRRTILKGAKAIGLKTIFGPVQSEYVLHPLKFKSYDEDFDRRLYIWEMPQENEEYAVGVDMGDGVGQDNSVCSVIRRASVWKPWAQVAELATPYMNASDFWPMVQAILLLYCVRRGDAIRQPHIVIEVRGNGDTVQHELRKRGWSNFYRWIRTDQKRVDPSKAHHIGILTTSWFRRQMIDRVISIFNNQEIDIGSPWCVDEFRRLERDEMKQQFRADSGAHDDRIMALGFGIWAMDVLNLNPKARRRVDTIEETDEPPYRERVQISDDDLRGRTFRVALPKRPGPVRL